MDVNADVSDSWNFAITMNPPDRSVHGTQNTFLESPSAMTEATALRNAAPVTCLPFEPYRALPDPELIERIVDVKAALGESLLILGHHYQQDPVIRLADLRGDSLKLSQLAARSQACRSIVFCGVHFMAETADILSSD